MKTKLTRISKRTIAFILTILMMISVLGIGTLITANAGGNETGYAFNKKYLFVDMSDVKKTPDGINAYFDDKCTNHGDSDIYNSSYIALGDYIYRFDLSGMNTSYLYFRGFKVCYDYKYPTIGVSSTTTYNCIKVSSSGALSWTTLKQYGLVSGTTSDLTKDTRLASFTGSGNSYTATASLSANTTYHIYVVDYLSDNLTRWRNSNASITRNSPTVKIYSYSSDQPSHTISVNADIAGSYTFAFPAKDGETFKVIYPSIPTHTAKVGTITGSGTVTVNDLLSTTVEQGKSYTIKATPSSGYKLTALAVNGKSIIGTHSGATTAVTVTHIMGSSTETVTATFTAITHNVSFSQPANGKIEVNGSTTTPQSFAENSNYTVKVTPDSGYKIKSLTIGGVSETAAVGKTDEYSVTKTMGKSAVTITAEFELAAQTKSLKYYVDLHSNTPSSTTNNPTIKFSGGNAVTLTREGTSTVYSADVPTPYSPTTNQVVNPATITFNGNSYNVNIGDKDINDIKEVWIESRGTLDGTTTDKFKVMSYASHVSTFKVENGELSGISTKLYGCEGNGNKNDIINDCGIITNNSDGSYTVKYAKEDTDTEYGELKLRVSFTTSAGEGSDFDGWYVGADKSGEYTSPDAEIWVDGNDYTLKYTKKYIWDVTVEYKYDLYNNSKVQYYDEEQAKEDKPMTYTVKGLTFKGDSIDDVMSESDLRENIEHNAPNLVNDYYQYALIPVPDTTDPDYGYSVDYDKNSLTCTITAHLKKTVRMYTVTLDGEKYGKGDYSYQAPITIQSGEVSEVGNTQSLIWLDDGREVATGSSYSFRVTGNMTITTKPNESGDTFDGRSIIAHRSYELNTALETNQLIQNFYIADFYNVSNYGLKSEFVGGGVLYYAVKDDENGAPTKAKDVVNSENGEADTKKLEDVVKRVAEDNYGSPDSNSIIQATDTNTNVVCRYVPYKDHHDVFKFSDSLQAYQYIYSANMKNSSDNGKYSLRVYSYFVYYDSDDPGDGYVISVSDNYADAKMYMAQ